MNSRLAPIFWRQRHRIRTAERKGELIMDFVYDLRACCSADTELFACSLGAPGEQGFVPRLTAVDPARRKADHVHLTGGQHYNCCPTPKPKKTSRMICTPENKSWRKTVAASGHRNVRRRPCLPNGTLSVFRPPPGSKAAAPRHGSHQERAPTRTPAALARQLASAIQFGRTATAVAAL